MVPPACETRESMTDRIELALVAALHALNAALSETGQPHMIIAVWR